MSDEVDFNVQHVPTSMISFVETQHGRDRRKQRGIDKKDLQAALKYGTQTEVKWGKSQIANKHQIRLLYKDIVYIVDKKTKKEITCWAKSTQLQPIVITPDLQRKHDHVKRLMRESAKETSWWQSNTVLVVDTSGSMREADVWGCRSRLHAAWFAVALDFVAHRIESGVAGPMDIVSVVTLSEAPVIIIQEEPCTWQLYNKLVRIYTKGWTNPAEGHGPYIPALKKVKKLLGRSHSSGCPLAVSLLSDGRPSDCIAGLSYEQAMQSIADEAGKLARLYGRRLTFATIGIGEASDFGMLEKIAEIVNDFGARGLFQRPSMTSSDLGNAFTTVSTSLTSTQKEQTDLDTLKQHRVRSVQQESRTKAAIAISAVSKEDFHIYNVSECVERQSYREYLEGRKRYHIFEHAGYQHSDAQYVAFARGPFGEGAERFAYRFYEVAADGSTILGKPLVAKESRFIDNKEMIADGESQRQQFVRTFCKTQQLALRLAEEFNQKLDETRRVHKNTPRIRFLDCSIYVLSDAQLGKHSVLVEERLFGEWEKWNCNNGFVAGMKEAPKYDGEAMRKAVSKLAESSNLDLIAEEDSDGDSTDDSESDVEGEQNIVEQIIFTPFDVAQAFSHFSYWATGRKRLVCDLQGVYDPELNQLQLSDPVIHYYNHRDADRTNVHGRTDRGRNGMAMFFDSHHEYCGHLCRLVNRGFHRSNHQHNQNGNLQQASCGKPSVPTS
jgi:hypothetical protein